MKTFLVESYVPNLDSRSATDLSSRLRATIADLQREGVDVRWLRSFALVDEETYVWMVTATDADQVTAVHERAAVNLGHVAEVANES